jgi:hypothetical protein
MRTLCASNEEITTYSRDSNLCPACAIAKTAWIKKSAKGQPYFWREKSSRGGCCIM